MTDKRYLKPDEVLRNKLKKSITHINKLILPKREILIKKCSDFHFSRPEILNENMLYGTKITDLKIQEELCSKLKLEAEKNYSLYMIINNVLLDCMYKLNSLSIGPICLSSPDVKYKSKCSNWRPYVFKPDEKLNEKWYLTFNEFLDIYDIAITDILEKFELGHKETAILTKLKTMVAKADDAYKRLLGVDIISTQMARENEDKDAIALSNEFAHMDSLAMLSGLPSA